MSRESEALRLHAQELATRPLPTDAPLGFEWLVSMRPSVVLAMVEIVEASERYVDEPSGMPGVEFRQAVRRWNSRCEEKAPA